MARRSISEGIEDHRVLALPEVAHGVLVVVPRRNGVNEFDFLDTEEGHKPFLIHRPTDLHRSVAYNGWES